MEANSFQDCIITYAPNNSSSGKIDEDKLILKVIYNIIDIRWK